MALKGLLSFFVIYGGRVFGTARLIMVAFKGKVLMWRGGGGGGGVGGGGGGGGGEKNTPGEKNIKTPPCMAD